ncbi:hypothetical protein [Streptomyces sp. SID12501]|uniref:TniQ family protein n=1 Tax=Streptomyces sp. SID12501 TaxID=2706042 RepID=A0A6B3C2R8_9ACTN|nr:hypothetical protein [Streptomyces sp. SID12501]NEC91091.1 hypothetical protein [Streptomyces sp. SID12501]
MIEQEHDRRLGVVPTPFAGESFLSWVDTVAVTMRLPRVAALRELGLPGPATFCLQASGGRWLLSWRLKWTFLCADHLVYLADRCPRCRLWLYWRHDATGPSQREHCTRPLEPRQGRGPRRSDAKVCGFQVREIPAIPVEDEEAVHVQRRVTALLAPADGSHNEMSRRLLQHMSGIVKEAARRKTMAGMLDRMESSVVRAVYESQRQAPHLPLAWTLENGSPAAVSAIVRIAARTAFSERPGAGPPG